MKINENKERNGKINDSNNTKMGLRRMDARSGHCSSMESWQGALLPVEGGLVVLDVPGLQHAAGLGVVVGVNNHGLR